MQSDISDFIQTGSIDVAAMATTLCISYDVARRATDIVIKMFNSGINCNWNDAARQIELSTGVPQETGTAVLEYLKRRGVIRVSRDGQMSRL